MMRSILFAFAALFAASRAQNNFLLGNGQIFSPGFAVLNAPQPGTPLGGGMRRSAKERRALAGG
jgi:hypothetical protein